MRALVVYPGWEVESHSSESLRAVERRPQARGVWLWSATAAPVRWPADRPPPAALAATEEWLEVQVGPGRVPAPAELRLVAAPVGLWAEVPEPQIPSWPVPEDGRLRLRKPPEEEWRLRLVGREAGSGWLAVAPGRRRVVIDFQAATDRRLRLVDGAGDPLAGLAVQHFEAVTGMEAGREPIAVYRSDAGGEVALPGVPGEVDLDLFVVSESHAPAGFSGRVSSLPALLRLLPGGTLAGRLVDADQRAVAGARIGLLAFLAPGSPRVVARAAVSDAAGSWRLAGLAPGQGQLTVEAEGFARWSRVLEIDGGESDLGRLTLERGRSAALLVTDPDGLGLPRAQALTSAGHRGTADSQGTIRFGDLPSGPPETAKVTAPGFLPATVRLDLERGEALVVRLTPAFRLTGRLLCAEGSPVAGGGWTLETGTRSTTGEIGDDGAFAVEMPPETAGTLVLASSRTAEVRVTVRPGEAGGVRDLGDLVAPPGMKVTGRLVRFEDGMPVPGARVWTLRSASDPLLGWARGDSLEASSDAEGRFEVAGLPAGTHRLRIDAPGLARRQVEIALGGDEASRNLGEVILDRGCEVTVTVGDEGDAPSGLRARLDLRGDWQESDMLTASVVEGAAVFAHVPPGRATLSVTRGHELVCDREVEVAGDDSTLTVDCREDGGLVRGTVFQGDEPAGPGRLTWSLGGPRSPGVILKRRAGELESDEVLWGGRPDVAVAVGPGGFFETTDLRVGRWEVAWASEAGLPLARRLEVRLGDAEVQEIALRYPGLAIHGTVVDVQQRGVAGARVQDLAQGAFGITAEDGSFALEGFEPGALRLRARLGDRSSEVLALEVQADRAPPPVRLVLDDRQVRVTFAVTGEDGAPRGGAFLFLEPEGEPLRLLTTDFEGRIEAVFQPPLPPRIRAATFAGGWELGGWLAFAEARDGVQVLMVGEGGTAEISTDEGSGAPGLWSEGGWDLAGLHLLLGRRLVVNPGDTTLVAGLPPGRYRAALGGVEQSFSVERDRARQVRLP
jgi:hypothetical protein